MASAPGAPFDVYISSAKRDQAWARRLDRDLAAFGLRSFSNLRVGGQSWFDELERSLAPHGAIAVLWSPAAHTGLRRDMELIEELMRRGRPERLIIPIVLGDKKLLDPAPGWLADRVAVTAGSRAYEAGPEAESAEWAYAVERIAQALAERKPTPVEPLPSFSTSSRRALTYAARMLGDRGDPARLRTAALLGALLASARTNMTPTTGDVVRFVIARQSDERDVERTLDAAAAAVGLDPIRGRNPRPMTVESLIGSSVRELVLDAVEMQRRTGADSVHLRHVLATGVHPAVPEEALAELGVRLDEVRENWRVSIAHTWPDESQEGWDDILVRLAGEGAAAAPPSARVHADTWTTEDRLDYALYAKAIAEFIRHEDAKPPMVISVQAPWGQGKTSLMRMVQRDLDPDHPDLRDPEDGNEKSAIVEPPSELTFGDLRESLDGTVEVSETKPAAIRTVWFNAWKYQSSEQIWAGLAHAILSQLPARLEPKDRELFWLRLQLRRIDPSAVRNDIYRAALERFLPRLAGLGVLALAILVVAGLALLAGGLGALGVGVAGGGVLGIAGVARRAWAAATKDVLERPLEGAYQRYVQQPDYSGKLGYLHLVEEDMVRALELLTPDDQPAVIFIDDLDRCSPAKVGEVIEAVNLFLAGDYPNCAFVIGIDAEVVAASMEVVHEEIIEKLADRRGELGWRFMDKFVQLPFVIPRLHQKQREAFLRGLFSIPGEEEEEELIAQADRLTSEARSDPQDVDELAQRAGELAPRLATFAPDKARALGEEVVSAGARNFSDTDPEVIQALADQLRYLSDNPRTIKRAVNLYRFHRFAAFARKASTLPLEVATPEQIGRWIVVIIRWPHFVRWLQAQREEAGSPGQDPAARVLELAGDSATAEAFTEALGKKGIDASWTDDAELWEFLREEAKPDLKLDLAGPRGLW